MEEPDWGLGFFESRSFDLKNVEGVGPDCTLNDASMKKRMERKKNKLLYRNEKHMGVMRLIIVHLGLDFHIRNSLHLLI